MGTTLRIVIEVPELGGMALAVKESLAMRVEELLGRNVRVVSVTEVEQRS